MTNFGIKIVGAEMEAGFTASTREDFESFIARLRWMADTVWPPVEATAPISDVGAAYVHTGGDYAQERAAAQRAIGGNAQEHVAAGGNYARQERAATTWREMQGL